MAAGRSIGVATTAVLMLITAACGSGTTTPAPSPTLTQTQRVAAIERATVELVGKTAFGTQAGSGIVVDVAKGLILTNNHVIGGVAALQIQFNDGETSAGRVLATSPCDDLAVVKVVSAPSTRPGTLALGDSSTVQAGDHVTAVGYPVSLQATNLGSDKPTATEGSVSKAGFSAEPDPSLPNYVSLIQHQAPINPGNSGGPLVNDRGQVIGINTLAVTATGGGAAVQGQYYAIGSNHIKTVLAQLETGQSLDDVGWSVIPNSRSVATYVYNNDGGIPETFDNGLAILGVSTGSPADSAALQFGDVIEQLEGVNVSTYKDLCDVLASHGPGQSIGVSDYSVLQRQGPGYYTTKLTLR